MVLGKPLFSKSNLSRKKATTLPFPYSLILVNKGIRGDEKGAALLLRELSKNKGLLQKKDE